MEPQGTYHSLVEYLREVERAGPPWLGCLRPWYFSSLCPPGGRPRPTSFRPRKLRAQMGAAEQGGLSPTTRRLSTRFVGWVVPGSDPKNKPSSARKRPRNYAAAPSNRIADGVKNELYLGPSSCWNRLRGPPVLEDAGILRRRIAPPASPTARLPCRSTDLATDTKDERCDLRPSEPNQGPQHRSSISQTPSRR